MYKKIKDWLTWKWLATYCFVDKLLTLRNKSTFKYFAYGSNLSLKRMQSCTPSASFYCHGYLRGWRLDWSKRSSDGSAKCTITCTDLLDDYVYGVIYEIPRKEKHKLIMAEGVGYGYKEEEIDVFSQYGTFGTYVTLTYVATEDYIDRRLRPYPWHKAHVIRGATEMGLPRKYINEVLYKVPCQEDLDKQRVKREEAIQE